MQDNYCFAMQYVNQDMKKYIPMIKVKCILLHIFYKKANLLFKNLNEILAYCFLQSIAWKYIHSGVFHVSLDTWVVSLYQN